MRLALLAAALAAAPALAQTPVALLPGPPSVTLSAEAKVERAPDLAVISAGVVVTAANAGAASRANAVRMTEVVAALRGAGVAERDIQTASLTLQPQYDYADRRRPRVTGYEARNTVTVRLRDLGRAGPTLDALVAAGANQIDGPAFQLADPDAALDTARAAAARKARARADLYAAALGLRVKRVLQLTEGYAQRPPYPVAMARMQSMDAAAESTPVAPGELTLAVTVTLTAELE